VTTAAAATPGDRPLTLDSVAPLPSNAEDENKKKKKPAATEKQRLSPAMRFALAAVLILAVAGGAYYARTLGYGPQNKEEASALAEKASDAMGTAIVAGASKVTETLGLGRIVPAKDPPSPAPASVAPPPAAVKSTAPRPRTAASPPVDMPSIVAFDLEPSPEPRPVPRPRSTTTAPAAAAPAPLLPAGEANAVDNDTIYSVNSGSVVPPLGVRPKLARQLPPDFDPTRLGRIELIIGVDGLVESAKLLGPPRTVNDGLFLSVAKAWQFQPALKDGLPVRYRKTIWVASP
jgi:hypothetical protein